MYGDVDYSILESLGDICVRLYKSELNQDVMTRIDCVYFFFFFKQKTAYEILTCDWSSDVCSSDLSNSVLRPLDYKTIHISAGNEVKPQLCLIYVIKRQIGRASCRERV